MSVCSVILSPVNAPTSRPSAAEEDGRTALAIALACERSRREGRAVAPDY